MKLKQRHTILFILCLLILVIIMYYFARSCNQLEYFSSTKKPLLDVEKDKYFSEKKSEKEKKNALKNLPLEASYQLKDKQIDEPQTLYVWDIVWIKSRNNYTSLQKLWKFLEDIFPKQRYNIF